MSSVFRVFLASPGDVPVERAALSRVVDEVNQTTAPLIDCRLEAVCWETHSAPDAGRPQQVINEQISQYDVFIGVMWRRFGTPSGVAGSGTEEEFRIAYKRWEESHQLALMFYFCEAPFYPKTLDELDQMKRVLMFRQELEAKALTWSYEDHDSFEATIRKHLCMRLPTLAESRAGTKRARATPDDHAINALRALWPNMSADVQRAFSIAYNENRLAGDPGIQTRDLIAALLRVQSPDLQQVVTDIPSAALPEPTKGPVSDEAYVIEERPWLSGCVASSIRRLGQSLPPGRSLTATDLFADIAKNGTGSTVALLRTHNVGPNRIDTILRSRNIEVVGA
jgi:hypothetical protein